MLNHAEATLLALVTLVFVVACGDENPADLTATPQIAVATATQASFTESTPTLTASTPVPSPAVGFPTPAPPTAEVTVTSPAATLTPTPPPSPISTPDSSDQAVIIELDKASYLVAETIVVSVTNGLDVPIFGQTGQSYCTILDLQKQVDGQWIPQAPCIAGAPPTPVRIDPGTVITIELPARSMPAPALGPGTYRVQLLYRLAPAGSPDGPDMSSFSATFLVEP